MLRAGGAVDLFEKLRFEEVGMDYEIFVYLFCVTFATFYVLRPARVAVGRARGEGASSAQRQT